MEFKRKINQKQDLKQSKINQKNENCNLNENKIGGCNCCFPSHAHSKVTREKSKEKKNRLLPNR